ncbi:hypothetical protein ANN_26818 [Periplaneta americana]|uniref:PiggyBac transposable element-derived protein domain-containing protein n=1 Tax=Periplaneta americana TaxID=6978 RepID=A0ABQ8RZ50_PERAM|nr:hypothetical protein ANN_26818 [Periplaneta americana]
MLSSIRSFTVPEWLPFMMDPLHSLLNEEHQKDTSDVASLPLAPNVSTTRVGGGRGRNCSQVTNNSDLGSVETAPDGTQWTIISPQAAPGRRARQNIVTDAPRLTDYAKRSIINGNHSSTVKLLIDDSMLLNIKSFTENRACQELQDDSLRRAFFRNTMSRNQFSEMLRFLRFDEKATWSQRLQTDCFAAATPIWNTFIANCLLFWKSPNFLRKGRNITCDNFFTAKCLGENLKCKNTSMVRTLKKSRWGVPPSAKSPTVPLHSTTIYKSGDMTLTFYKCEKNKNVLLSNGSTLHCEIWVPQVAYACFFNVLDLAAINAWILYKEITGDVSWCQFIFKLGEELAARYETIGPPAPLPERSSKQSTFVRHVRLEDAEGRIEVKISVQSASSLYVGHA